jgi:hypothetical protein
VIEASPRPDTSEELEKKAHTYLKIPLKFDDKGDSHEVCIDTGTSTILVDKGWLKKYGRNVRYRSQPLKQVTGVNSNFSISEAATFDFYVPGIAAGVEVYTHFTVTADIMEGLGPKLLLGTRFLHDHGAKVDFINPSVIFRSAHNMKTQGSIFRPRLKKVIRDVRVR